MAELRWDLLRLYLDSNSTKSLDMSPRHVIDKLHLMLSFRVKQSNSTRSWCKRFIAVSGLIDRTFEHKCRKVRSIISFVTGRDVNQSKSVRTNLSKLPRFEMIF